MLRIFMPMSLAAGLLAALPALASEQSSAGVYDDTSYPNADATFTPAQGPIVTADVVYDGARTVVVNGLATRDETALRLARYDDTTYPSVDPVTAPTAPRAPENAAPPRLACGCIARH